MNERISRLRTHQKNIERYQTLLKTKLNDVEVQFLEKRLSEERLAVVTLQLMGSSGDAKGDHLVHPVDARDTEAAEAPFRWCGSQPEPVHQPHHLRRLPVVTDEGL